MRNIIKKLIKSLRKKKIVPIVTPVDSQKILQGKKVLITGGSSGIGLAIAEALLKSGAQVIIAGTNVSKLEKTVKNIGNPSLHGLILNVMDTSSMYSKILEAESLGGGNIDILINSAGTHNTLDFNNMTEEEFDKIMSVNVKGTFFMCQAMVRYMKERNIKGHILNLSSSSALKPASSPYSISKWAIRGFTSGLAAECQKYGIVVNAIAPGQTATPMLGVDENEDISNGYAIAGRYIMPQEIANLAVFMVSDMGNMIVGDTFYMTGGSGITTFNG